MYKGEEEELSIKILELTSSNLSSFPFVPCHLSPRRVPLRNTRKNIEGWMLCWNLMMKWKTSREPFLRRHQTPKLYNISFFFSFHSVSFLFIFREKKEVKGRSLFSLCSNTVVKGKVYGKKKSQVKRVALQNTTL